MPITTHAEGSITVTVGTEHFLNSPDPDTTVGVFQLVLDVSQLGVDEELEVRAYEKVRSASANPVVTALYIIAYPPADPSWRSPEFVFVNPWRISIKQVGGTARTFEWSIRRIS